MGGGGEGRKNEERRGGDTCGRRSVAHRGHLADPAVEVVVPEQGIGAPDFAVGDAHPDASVAKNGAQANVVTRSVAF